MAQLFEKSRAVAQRDRTIIFYRFPYAAREDRTINDPGKDSSSASFMTLNDFPNLLYTDVPFSVIADRLGYPKSQLDLIRAQAYTYEMFSTYSSLLVSEVNVNNASDGGVNINYSYTVEPMLGKLDFPALTAPIPPLVDAMLSGSLMIPGAESLSDYANKFGGIITDLSSAFMSSIGTKAKSEDTQGLIIDNTAQADMGASQTYVTYTWNVPSNKKEMAALNLRTAFSPLVVTGYTDAGVFPKITIKITKYAYRSALAETYPMYEWFRTRFAPLRTAAAIPQFLIYSKDLNNKLLEINLLDSSALNNPGIMFHIALIDSVTFTLTDYDYSWRYIVGTGYGAKAFFKRLDITLVFTLMYPYLVKPDDILDPLVNAIKSMHRPDTGLKDSTYNEAVEQYGSEGTFGELYTSQKKTV